MPCDEYREISVSLPNLDEEIVKEVIAELKIAAIYKNGELKLFGQATVEDATRIKVAYSHKVVKKLAKKRGWNVKQTSETEYELER